MPIKVGEKAPDFTLKSMTADGLKDVSLAEALKKGKVALLFFPAAFTGVCTQELCDASTGFGSFGKSISQVFGISVDSPFALDAWGKANNITVPLLSDYKHEVVKAYDVVLPDLVGLGPASSRAAFVIDKSGTVVYSEQTATPLDLPNFEAVKAALS